MINIGNINSVIETVTIANTPSYIIKELKINKSVFRIAKENSRDEIIKYCSSEEINKFEKYALIFALYIKSGGEVAKELLDINDKDEWVQYVVKELFKRENVSFSTIVRDASQIREVAFPKETSLIASRTKK
ncbi:hypothetical protein [Komagataeibacter diospyri]|uniref:hypothetical protein n=1 Tax=Komagataeibacter diospyri TaxID=1932662 RepID=UPI00375840CF